MIYCGVFLWSRSIIITRLTVVSVSHCIYFIDVNDGRCAFSRFFEQLSNFLCTDTNIHLSELGRITGKKWNSCLSWTGLGQRCFTCSRWPIKYDSFPHSSPKLLIGTGVLHEIDDLFESSFGIFKANDILKSRDSSFWLFNFSVEIKIKHRSKKIGDNCRYNHN